MKKESLRLYAVTDRGWLHGCTLYEQVEGALRGGVTMVQLREKHKPESEFLAEAVRMKALCASYGVPLIVNDNVEIAIRAGADGVHLGQKDMDVHTARRMLGPDKIIGASARTKERAQLVQAQGADYIGVGAVFATGTKQDAQVISLERLREVCGAVTIPAAAIGGISAENVESLADSGISGVAVVSALFAKKDVQKAAQSLIEKLEQMGL